MNVYINMFSTDSPDVRHFSLHSDRDLTTGVVEAGLQSDHTGISLPVSVEQQNLRAPSVKIPSV